MKRSSLLFCLMLSVVLLYDGVCPISAQAPKTAKIVFVSARDGTDVQQIVNEADPKARNPVWSPLGDEIVYTQEIAGHLQLFKIDVGSRVVTQLTHIGVLYQANVLADWFDPITLDVSPQPQLLPIEWGKIKKK